MAFTQATIQHQFINPDGSGAVGQVQWTLTKAMTNGTSTMLPMSFTSPVQSGSLSATVTSTKDLATDPPDAQWRVDIRLSGMDPMTYFVTVPSGGGTIDLGTLLPSEGSTVPMDISTQWQTYLDLNLDVKPYLQMSPTNTKYDANQLQSITAMACVWVQNYIQKPVPPTTFTRKFDGWSGWQGAYIELPYYPVLQVVSISEWWGGSGGHNLIEQTPQNQGGGEMYQVDRLTGEIRRTFPGLIEKPFFPGSRNIEVTWIAGFNPVPKDIRMATLELVDYWYRNTQEAERVARPQMEYEEPGPGALWPAIPNRVTALLEAYRPLVIG